MLVVLMAGYDEVVIRNFHCTTKVDSYSYIHGKSKERGKDKLEDTRELYFCAMFVERIQD